VKLCSRFDCDIYFLPKVSYQVYCSEECRTFATKEKIAESTAVSGQKPSTRMYLNPTATYGLVGLARTADNTSCDVGVYTFNVDGTFSFVNKIVFPDVSRFASAIGNTSPYENKIVFGNNGTAYVACFDGIRIIHSPYTEIAELVPAALGWEWNGIYQHNIALIISDPV
jgi:hypothetical protein